MTLKKITWVDIAGGDSWMSAKDATKWGREKYHEHITTTGYVIHRNKYFVVIAATYDEAQGNFHDVSMIPTAVIKKIETLK